MEPGKPLIGNLLLVSNDPDILAYVVEPLRMRQVVATVVRSWKEMEAVLCQIKPDVVALSSSLVPRDLTVLEKNALHKYKVPIVLLANDGRATSTLITSRLNVLRTVATDHELHSLVSVLRCALDDVFSRSAG